MCENKKKTTEICEYPIFLGRDGLLRVIYSSHTGSELSGPAGRFRYVKTRCSGVSETTMKGHSLSGLINEVRARL